MRTRAHGELTFLIENLRDFIDSEAIPREDLRPFCIYDGAGEVHRAAIAQRALRHALTS